MIAELLEFTVPAAKRDAWLAADERVWTKFLARQPGFAGKQVWAPDDEEETLMVVVWWQSRADWERITKEQIASIDEQMGDQYAAPSLRIMTVCATQFVSGVD